MKTIRNIYFIAVFTAISGVAAAQNFPDEYLGLPGDNLNLYAVMNLFQESETLEGFERSLNSEEQMINNLDLNGDNLIDYITVSDYVEGNVHTIVLRAALNPNEQQDVAVFVVQKLRNGAVQIQLIGDEALYGPNYIVEPIYAETPNPGYTGTVYSRNVNYVTTTYYDIAAWPLIRFIFHPRYVVWRSSWYWGYYPTYWRPWRSHYWHYYYGYHYNWHNHYYTHYRHWDHFRCRSYTTFYRSKVRVYSPTVVVNINNNRYMSTYSRPEHRRAGEEYYTRTASNRSNSSRNAVYNGRNESRSGTVAARQNVQRTSTQANRSRENVASSSRNTNTVRSSSATRNSSTRSAAVRTNRPDNRSAVNSSVQHSSRSKTTPAVQRSSNSNRSSAVQRNQPGKSRSSAVQRSQPNKNRSSTVQRNNNSNRKSNASVSRNSSKKSTPSVQRKSSSSNKKSSGNRRNSRN
jgi:hypothetical protein